MTVKRRMPSTGSPKSSGFISPMPGISSKSSCRWLAVCGSSSGPMRTSSSREPAGFGAGAGAALAAGAGAAAACAEALSRLASLRISATSGPVSGASSVRPCWKDSSPHSASPPRSSTSTIGGVGDSSWRRSRSSSVSISCASVATAVKPKVAAPPLIECATRKIALSVSSSTAAGSSASSSCSML